MTWGRTGRWARAGALAGLSTAWGVAGHQGGPGHLDPGGVLWALLLTLLLALGHQAVPAAGPQGRADLRRAGSLAVVLAGGQVAVHLGQAVVGAMALPGSHGHASTTGLPHGTFHSAADPAALLVGLTHGGGLMLGTHLVAAVAAALAHAALVALGHWGEGWWAVLQARPLVPVRVLAPVPSDPRPVLPVVPSGSWTLRGPPVTVR